MTVETVKTAIDRLASDKRVLEGRIRQIDQSISLLQSIALKAERESLRVRSDPHQRVDANQWTY